MLSTLLARCFQESVWERILFPRDREMPSLSHGDGHTLHCLHRKVQTPSNLSVKLYLPPLPSSIVSSWHTQLHTITWKYHSSLLSLFGMPFFLLPNILPDSLYEAFPGSQRGHYSVLSQAFTHTSTTFVLTYDNPRTNFSHFLLIFWVKRLCLILIPLLLIMMPHREMQEKNCRLLYMHIYI